MKITLLKKSSLLVLFLISTLSSFAQIRLPVFFGDHMVLQQQRPIRIWGTALPGEWVRVSMEGRVTVATADDEGKWVATFGAVAAGGPYELKMQTPSDTMTLSDVWVGEVWFCLGQSNMEWPLRRATNGAAEIAAAALPQIRYFKVPHRMAMQPTDDLPTSSWTICQPETAPNYSAVAYFFAKHINQQQNVPVGLIEASWGGTTIASWMSPDALANHPKFGTQVANMAHLNLGDLQDSIAQAATDWLGAIETTDIGLQENWQTEAIDWRSWPTMLLPQPWETGGPINVDGAVWFKTAFELESKQTKANISLSLGVLDDRDETYVNGHLIGQTGQDYRAFRVYTIPDTLLKVGENIITVRIRDYGYVGGFMGQPNDLKLVQGEWAYSLAGAWHYQVGTTTLPRKPEPLSPNSYPTLLYNGMVHPFRDLRIGGMLWYQGESDLNDPFHYRDLFLKLLDDYRQQWRMGDFPFVFTQLPYFRNPASVPLESGWATMRESQALLLKRRNTGMAVLIDEGEPYNIHPQNKEVVGQRLATVTKQLVFEQQTNFSGPELESVEILDQEIRLTFQGVGEGLRPINRQEDLKGFAIAGEDGRFQWAKAELLNATQVRVYHPAILAPRYIRYAWSDNPGPLNLYNMDGLPAAPFRTDKFKLPWE